MDFFSAETPPEPAPDSWRENVAAIVMDAAGRVLLGLGTGHNAYWHFPQGGMGSRETAEDALRRELQEEVALPPQAYRIVASYGGLRYRYRKNNDKHARWRGQQQTYFLVLCHAEMPPTDCSGTDEFCALTWVPWRELTPELFAPVKRKVVARVLATFFPADVPEGELLPSLERDLTPARYRMAGRRLADCPTDDRALFGGGKEEMLSSLERMGVSLRAAHKRLSARGGKLLVVLHGAEGAGRKQALRRLATHLDPLHLHAAERALFSPGLAWELPPALPAEGAVSLIIPKDGGTAPQDWLAQERWLMGQGIRVLKLYLRTDQSPADDALLAATDSAVSPWYIIPAERRWYRDYLVSTLVAEALESSPRSWCPGLWSRM